MGWLSNFFGGGKAAQTALAPQNETALISAFARDVGGPPIDVTTAFEGVEELSEHDRLAIVDWADDPEMVLENLDVFLSGGDALSSDQIDNVLKVGALANEKGRGHAALPTICALDDLLMGSGTRLLWIDTGGDSYSITRVSDAIWAKWHNVRIGDVSLLAADVENELPRNRKLAVEPR